ncbi:DUF3397 family protein [Marinilactibacillus sp. GCM10026970]|uniref:DUF3397 family protein n=1 Tax=Marinilactibacillus sp. GCM10026970 TaxID=3252642 RepID=UPI003615F72F
MFDPHIDIYFILFYLCPILMLSPSKRINKFFKKQGVKIKLVDFVTPVFLLSVHIYSMLIVNRSFMPYVLIIISIIGMVLASVFAFKIKKIRMVHFFRVWWRYVFITVFLLHILLGILLFF